MGHTYPNNVGCADMRDTCRPELLEYKYRQKRAQKRAPLYTVPLLYHKNKRMFLVLAMQKFYKMLHIT